MLQTACEAAEAAYSQACCTIHAGKAFLQAKEDLHAQQSHILLVGREDLSPASIVTAL